MKPGAFNVQQIIFNTEKGKGLGKMWWERAKE
jgi:hypothetical protein